MKYLKLFESFDGNNFIVDDQTTPQQLTDYLYERVDEYSNYGSENTFSDILETLVENSLIAKEKMEEDKADELASNFIEKHITTDSSSTYDQYDSYERRYEGWVKFDGVEIFNWSSAGDGYGYGGSIEKEQILLQGLKKFLSNWQEYQ